MLDNSHRETADLIQGLNEGLLKEEESRIDDDKKYQDAVTGLHNDRQALQAMHGLVLSSYERCSRAQSEAFSKTSKDAQAAVNAYINHTIDHVRAAEALLQVFSNRIKFCSAKLSQATEEQKQIQSMGLGAVGAQNNAFLTQLKQSVNKDTQAAEELRAKVRASIARVPQVLPLRSNIGQGAVLPLQRLLQELKACKPPFDIRPIQNAIEELKDFQALQMQHNRLQQVQQQRSPQHQPQQKQKQPQRQARQAAPQPQAQHQAQRRQPAPQPAAAPAATPAAAPSAPTRPPHVASRAPWAAAKAPKQAEAPVVQPQVQQAVSTPVQQTAKAPVRRGWERPGAARAPQRQAGSGEATSK